jgi:hypothetical protein
VLGAVIGYAIGTRWMLAPMPAAPPITAARDTAVPTDTEVAVAPSPPTPAPGVDRSVDRADVDAAALARAPERGTSARPVAAAASAPIETGRLLLRSLPPGADVLIDGRARGATPLALRDLALGVHTLEVVRAGYLPHIERVVLTRTEPARNLTFELQPAGRSRPPGRTPPPAPTAQAPARPALLPPSGRVNAGSIYLDSRPRGARVVLDGVDVGATPMLLPGVPTGARTVRLELRGYKTLATTVEVIAGQQSRFVVTLEPAGGRSIQSPRSQVQSPTSDGQGPKSQLPRARWP